MMSYYLLTSSNDQWLIRPVYYDRYDYTQLSNPFEANWIRSTGKFSGIKDYPKMTLLQVPDTLVLLRARGALT